MAVATAMPSLAAAQEAAKTVGEVTVTGQAAPVRTTIDRHSYDVGSDLQSRSGAIADVLRNLPSVEVDVDGDVSLRGDSHVTILIDGKPSNLFQGDGKGQALLQLPADSIERVEVITNPSAEFGANGSAGVINLISRQAKGAGRTGSLKLTGGPDGRVVGGVSAGFNSPRLSVTSELNLRQDTQKQRNGDDRLQADLATGVFGATDQDQAAHLKYDTASGRTAVDYGLSPKTRIGGEVRFDYLQFRLDGLSHFSDADPSGVFADAFDRQLDIVQKRANGEVTADVRRKFADDGELTLSLSHEETNDNRVRSGETFDQVPPAADAFDQQRLDYRLHQTELKGDYSRSMAGAATVKLGFDLQYDDNDYRNRGFAGPSSDVLAPDLALTNLFVFRQTLSQAYVTYERPFGGLTVQAGLRVEDMRLDLDQVTLGQKVENDELRAYPSLHLAWKQSDTSQLTASYSHRVQRPEPNDYNSFRFLLDPANYRAGNPYLKPQQTQSFELGYEYRRTPLLVLTTLYYRENRDGIADVVRDLGDGVFLTERANLAQSRTGGLEVVANGRFSKTLTYSLSGNLAWTQLDTLGPQFAPTRSLVSVSGHGNLSWQMTARDLWQLNGFLYGKRLTAQGHVDPQVGLNLGYRHKLNDQVAFMLTAQDLLGTFGRTEVFDTPTLKGRLNKDVDSRFLLAGVVWTFGGGRQHEPTFDFGSAPPP